MSYISNLPLSKKIASGYVIIMFVSLLSGLVVFFNLQKLKTIDEEISQSNTNLIIKLKDFSFLVNESVKLSNAWIYQPDKKNKDRLLAIEKIEFNDSKSEILSIAKNYTEENSLKTSINGFFATTQTLIQNENAIINTLSSDEKYSDDVAVDKAINIYSKKIEPSYQQFIRKYNQLQSALDGRRVELSEIKSASYFSMFVSIFVVVLTVIIVGIVVTNLSRIFVTNPINKLQNVVELAGKGELNDVIVEDRNDEIGKINNSISELVKNLKSKTDFAISIGQREYDKDLSLFSEGDVLGKALREMRDSLKAAQIEDRNRDWFNSGLAEISEVLRKYQNEDTVFYEKIIAFVVKYLHANQGSIFELIEEANEDIIELKACYAFDRKKYLHKKLIVGEGLLGEAVLEKDYIYLTDIPHDYINITSGLGGTKPSCLLILPLIYNEKVYGAIEIASFDKFVDFEINFALKIGESIAASISNLKINAITKTLLNEAQESSEVMKSQEEEMRQTFEELHATQEQLRRQEKELIKRHNQEIEAIKNAQNASTKNN